MKSRRLSLAALACGLAIAVVAQRLTPMAGPPLYDGVIVEDEYKWLAPPHGYTGGPQSASDSGAVQGTQSPNLSVGTPEQPPQAQVFAGQGYLVMPPGTTAIDVSIQPVPPAAQPGDGVIAGNVYRISLTSQGGAALTGDAGGGVTVVLRGPRSLPSATIERLVGGSWTPLQTDPAGVPHMFTAVVTDFGDFALVAPPGWVPDPPVPAQSGPAGPVAPPVSTGTATPGGPSGPASGSGSGPPFLLIACVGLVLGIAVVAGLALMLVKAQTRSVVGRPERRMPPPKRPALGPRQGPPRRRR